MHSSRMHTACSSSHPGGSPHTPPRPGTPLGADPPGGDPLPLGVGLETPQPDPLNFPLGCGPGDPLARSPSTSYLGMDLETSPGQIPLNSPPGFGPGNLQGMLGYHPTPPRPAVSHAGIQPAMHAGIPPPMDRQTDTCKNITFANYVCGVVIKNSISLGD